MSASITSEDGDMGFQIAPMVDVVFVLLLFFMAAAGAQLLEKELTIKVPTQADRHDLHTPIFIDIDATGRVSINDTVYAAGAEKDLSRMSAWLGRTVADYSEDPVIIRPSYDVRHERIIDVLNACAVAKVKNVSFN